METRPGISAQPVEVLVLVPLEEAGPQESTARHLD